MSSDVKATLGVAVINVLGTVASTRAEDKQFRKQIVVVNRGPAALSACSIEASPNGTDWQIGVDVSMNLLAAGASGSYATANDYRPYWRVMCATTTNTTVDVYIYSGD